MINITKSSLMMLLTGTVNTNKMFKPLPVKHKFIIREHENVTAFTCVVS